ncbi:RDD family protein [Leeuwenhoekiella parthenopeia]|uniref:RDD family protein n=1 Tax=Leeuwenhoekiella parthenopeia TaxID=2890320 RepID=A0ABS8GXG8_9FLAO|nr:RDD family protein [Leeuwenhoekiella parthenopeia]MCC4214712.1 RDD family protein [Leeuwenhoekiella parthenopeia]
MNNYAQRFKNLSDKELVRIVTVEVHKYEPEAVKAAEAELSKRGIGKLKMAELVKEVAQENTAVQEIHDYVSSSTMRFTNFCIDFVVYIVLVLAGSLALDSVFVTTESDLILGIGYFMMFVIFMAYYGLSEFYFQKTAGKYVTKTIVVTKEGAKPDATTIIIRTLCRLIPFDRLSFLITKNGLHDRFSNTTVIREKD